MRPAQSVLIVEDSYLLLEIVASLCETHGIRVIEASTGEAALTVLRERGVGIRTMTAELGVHRTTVLRLLTTLVDAGYAAPSTAPGHGYVIGPALRREASPSQEVERFAKVARPFLAALVESTGECAHAAVADGGRVLVVDDVETDQPLRVVPTPGRHVPLHCTSAGKNSAMRSS